MPGPEVTTQGSEVAVQELREVLGLLQQIRSEGGAVGGGVGIPSIGLGPGGVGNLSPSLVGRSFNIPGARHLIGRVVGEMLPGYGRAAAVGARILMAGVEPVRAGIAAAYGGIAGGRALEGAILAADQAHLPVGARAAVRSLQAANAAMVAMGLQPHPVPMAMQAARVLQHPVIRGIGAVGGGLGAAAIGGLAAVAPYLLIAGAIHTASDFVKTVQERNKPGNFKLTVGDLVANNRPERFQTSYRDYSETMFMNYMAHRSRLGVIWDTSKEFAAHPVDTVYNFLTGNMDRSAIGMSPEALTLVDEIAKHSKYLNSKSSFFDMMAQTLNDSKRKNPPSPEMRDQVYRKYNREAFLEYHSGYMFEEADRRTRYRGKAGVN